MKSVKNKGVKSPHQSMLKRLLRSLAMTGGSFGIAAGAMGPVPVAAQDVEYRTPEAVPAAWRDYAQRVQGQFRARLTADDDAFRHLQAAHDDSSKINSRVTVIIRTWVAGDGKVERIEFSGLDAGSVAALRSVLMRENIGAPPPGMLQPLNLKLSLEDKS